MGEVVLEYIECTHCGKRYAVNEKIRQSEGDFVRCKNCLEKFMLVIHDATKRGVSTDKESFNATKGWDPTLTAPPTDADALRNSDITLTTETKEPQEEGVTLVAEADERESTVVDWDPSMTMPESPAEQDDAEETLSEEEEQAKAAATLQAIQQTKKKKWIVYGVLAAAVILLGLTLYMALSSDETQGLTAQNTSITKRVSPEDLDKQNTECRTAAARQWILDYKAMHENYDAKTFMQMLKQAENREADVKSVCKNPRLLKAILDAATLGETPDWFAAEVQAISRK
ncbi:MAG TPA: hypothetical protein EYP39_03870 [Ghiorsea sp.]|nr:hypothetical protein [Ghiorsea sp.]